MKTKVIIIGAGAAGYFTAINLAEASDKFDITLLERSNKVLQKVKVSGGGRCNVTHACFDPKELVEAYPRGKKELLGPFHQFMTGDTMDWFEKRGVPLKIEADNRVFPQSNSSQTIVDSLTQEANKFGVNLILDQKVLAIKKLKNNYIINCESKEYKADVLVVASGSNPKIWNMMHELGHNIIKPVPSLFTFKISDERLKDIPGISVQNASVELEDPSYKSSGPVLITHWGLSGPAILKLSAVAARYLANKNYQYSVRINWLSRGQDQVFEELKLFKNKMSKNLIEPSSVFKEIPNRLWKKLLSASNIASSENWADLSNEKLTNLSDQLCNAAFLADGKATFKEEFVTSGGIDLKEINFKRFESKIHKNLFFAGEVLNIDAITGGYNFQNAWTGGYIVARSISALS